MKYKIKRALLYPIFHIAYFIERNLTDFVYMTDDKYGFIEWTVHDMETGKTYKERKGAANGKD